MDVRPVPASRACRYKELCRGGGEGGGYVEVGLEAGKTAIHELVVLFFLGISGHSWSFDGTLRD